MWQKKAGPENDFLDGRTGIHHTQLENSATGGQHHLQILLGAESCSHCKRPFPKNYLGALDPKSIVAEALDMLSKNHQAVLDYATKHGVQIKTAHPTPTVPEGFRYQKGTSMLQPVKKA